VPAFSSVYLEEAELEGPTLNRDDYDDVSTSEVSMLMTGN
jgi:hypothetical protein